MTEQEIQIIKQVQLDAYTEYNEQLKKLKVKENMKKLIDRQAKCEEELKEIGECLNYYYSLLAVKSSMRDAFVMNDKTN